MGRCSEIGSHGCNILMLTSRQRIASADMCLLPELSYLSINGIETIGCCCGHPGTDGATYGYIQVMPEYVEDMEALGYEQLPTIPVDDCPEHDMCQWCFKPKTDIVYMRDVLERVR